MESENAEAGAVPPMRKTVTKKKRKDFVQVPGVPGQADGYQPETSEPEVRHCRPKRYFTRANSWADWFVENVQPGQSVAVPFTSNLSRRQIEYALKDRGVKVSIFQAEEGRLVCRR